MAKPPPKPTTPVVPPVGSIIAWHKNMGMSPEPPPPPAYHPRFDRGGQIPGGNLWEERPANGSIGFADFLSLVRQNRATCVLPP